MPPPTGDKPLPVPAEGCPQVPPLHQGVPGQGEPLGVAQLCTPDPAGSTRQGGDSGPGSQILPFLCLSAHRPPHSCTPNSHQRRTTLTGWCCSMPPAPEACPRRTSEEPWECEARALLPSLPGTCPLARSTGWKPSPACRFSINVSIPGIPTQSVFAPATLKGQMGGTPADQTATPTPSWHPGKLRHREVTAIRRGTTI